MSAGSHCYGYGRWLSARRFFGEKGWAYIWDAPIKEYERVFSKLKLPEIHVDYDMTSRVVALAKEILGDILQVRLRGFGGGHWD